MKNKYYKYTVIMILSINILLMLANYILDITLYYDVYSYILWLVLITMIILYSHKKSCAIIVCKITGVIIILIITLIVLIGHTYIRYGKFYSPNHTNQVILKQTSGSKSLHHRYYSVEVYKLIGGIFKRNMGKRIYEYDIPLFVDEPMFEIDPNHYKIDYCLYIEWLSEDILHMYADKERKREDEVLDIIINFNE